MRGRRGLGFRISLRLGSSELLVLSRLGHTERVCRRSGCQRELRFPKRKIWSSFSWHDVVSEALAWLQKLPCNVLIDMSLLSTHAPNMKEIKKNHKKPLPENKHVMYLYIPYTDTVVVLRCKPLLKWKGP